MAVHVGVAASSGAYRAQSEAAHAMKDGPCHHLLMFYAVECGLKAAVMRDVLKIVSTEQLPDRLQSHNLRELAKAVGMSSGTYSDLDRICKRRHRELPGVPVGELHQAWRYGAALDADDEGRMVDALAVLDYWCLRRFGR